MQGISRISQHFLNIQPKQEQLQAVCGYVSGKDTVLVAPTGFGKSLIYQLGPCYFDTDRYAPSSGFRATTTTDPISPEEEVFHMDTLMSSLALTDSDTASSLGSPKMQSTPTRPADEEVVAAIPGTGEQSILQLSSKMMDVSITPISKGHSQSAVSVSVSLRHGDVGCIHGLYFLKPPTVLHCLL